MLRFVIEYWSTRQLIDMYLDTYSLSGIDCVKYIKVQFDRQIIYSCISVCIYLIV